MKALVLAGGTGSRLRPFSHSMPKQLIPIANKPVLAHCLESLAAVGVHDVGVIVGDRGDEIQASAGDGSAYGLRLTYLRQDRPRGLAHCVRIARPFLGNDDFVMYLGDNMLVGGIGSLAEEFHRTRPAAQVTVTKVTDPREYGVAEVDADGRVTALVEKPQHPRSDLAVIGVYFFTPEIHSAVRRIAPSPRGELEITDAIALLVAEGRPVNAGRFEGYWKDTGRIEDVLDCNRELLSAITTRVDGTVDAASELIGEVIIEPGARVTRSRIVGPVMIAAGSVIDDSRLGPYTTVGRNCQLRGAGVEQSIVLDSVAVTQVRGIYGSVLGRGARVRNAPADGLRRRLVLGDDTEVEIAA
ncbi:glucose-1-phosphate thymidylyltransferase [Winogradskya humida]|uniref:Glucose-1-phosphate thymidylyltransferase n=1 Tax=Winogradskya humida TaxID=113566 RepID=A0ABQ4A093_9ACTN|nr:glucose-1-phosphate thymidylyltransferase [Actinoplanes humidus]GIE24291.1 glucose-1-phosphate thymidylyltransferase [Actinoplanes humidus]